MTRQSVAALCAALLLTGCFENSACQSGCVNIPINKSDTSDTIDKKLRAACEEMGLKGKPEITERSSEQVSGHCPRL